MPLPRPSEIRLLRALRLGATDPGLGASALKMTIRSTAHLAGRPQILIGTHHKILTVYLQRVFSDFAKFTRRRGTSGQGGELDYSADILRDHHSRFDFEKARPGWVGLHVVRDPRDLLVSAVNYHTRSTEPWLHVARSEFGGMTYQQKLLSFDDAEQRLLFELDNASRNDISDLANWDYSRPGMSEVRYEDLVAESGDAVFAGAIAEWPLSDAEKALLVRLFRHYSIHGKGTKRQAHIRNPSPEQWKKHFTPAIQAAFDVRFPDLPRRMGYA